jgi:hypothetical protein
MLTVNICCQRSGNGDDVTASLRIPSSDFTRLGTTLISYYDALQQHEAIERFGMDTINDYVYVFKIIKSSKYG